MLRMLVAVLLRQAKKNAPGQPERWLADLQSTKWEGINKSNGQITGTSVNGKSVYVAAVPGASVADLLMATEIALRCVELGLEGPPAVTQARFV